MGARGQNWMPQLSVGYNASTSHNELCDNSNKHKARHIKYGEEKHSYKRCLISGSICDDYGLLAKTTKQANATHQELELFHFFPTRVVGHLADLRTMSRLFDMYTLLWRLY